jgi:hypothetical protein
MQTKIALGGMAAALLGVAGAYALLHTAEEGPRAEAPRTPTFVQEAAAPALEPPLATTLPPSDPAPAPVAEPAEPPSRATLAASGSLRLRRLVAATGIESHEPVGASDEFEVGAQERIYAFVDAVNEDDAPATLHVTFEPEQGESTGHVQLEIPAHAGRFRTWAFTRNARSAGHWTIVVRDADGRVLGERAIELVD